MPQTISDSGPLLRALSKFLVGALLFLGFMQLLPALKDRVICLTGTEVMGAVKSSEMKRFIVGGGGRRTSHLSRVGSIRVSYPTAGGAIEMALPAWHEFSEKLSPGSPVRVRYWQKYPRQAALPDGLRWPQIVYPLLLLAMGVLGFLALLTAKVGISLERN